MKRPHWFDKLDDSAWFERYVIPTPLWVMLVGGLAGIVHGLIC